MYVCVCKRITEQQIDHAVNRGTTAFEDLRRELQVATACGRCTSCARERLRESLGTRNPATA